MQTFKKILLSNQAVLSILLLIILAIIILLLPALLPDNIGRIDFRSYWSSSYLLARGQDFSDSSNMDYVERTLTGWKGSFTMHAWFAPIGNLILLPFTLIPFARASYFWLLTNITVVFVSLFLLWRDTRKSIWIPIVAAFGFSITLVSFIYGQVNTLVVLGLALFLYFSKSGLEYAAGASLGLTTIKPHLVILTLPILLVDVIWRKQWRIVAGFVGVLIGCSLILFILYPAWPTSFWRLITSGMEAVRETPTINGLLVVTRGHTWGKWIWVIVLPLALLAWWKHREEWDRRTLIDLSVLVGLLVSPVGWSYDQVMLLFPILRILEWVVDGSMVRKDVIIVISLLIIMNAITFYERIITPSEVWYFWVPLFVAVVYLFAWQRSRQANLQRPVQPGLDWHSRG